MSTAHDLASSAGERKARNPDAAVRPKPAQVRSAAAGGDDRTKRHSGEIRKLTSLLDVSQALSSPVNIKSAFHRVLEILERYHGTGRSVISLPREEDARRLRLHASIGIRAHHSDAPLGATLAQQVFDTGRPVVVPRVSQEPALAVDPFRAERGDRGPRGAGRGIGAPGLDSADTTYICVPIQQSRRVGGVLEVELGFRTDRNYDRSVKFYGVVASMLAQALRVQQLLESERQRLVDENVRLRDELRERYDFSHILGNSGAMRQVCEQVVQVARTNTTVLIRGESGTGKELIAQAIHYNSLRARKAFLKVSCAALPESLIESELFGYDKGAFTGAEQRKKGRFELADGGTLLLDEIGDVSLTTQVKLLRVLQEREFERLGGTEPVRVDVRVIAATNNDMESAVATGKLRQDLFYRLNVFTIFIPPLRERKSDILLLADHFVEKLATEHGKQVKRISTPAIDALVAYHWPGNVRELQNVIERAVLVSDGQVIHMHHLPPTLQTAEGSGTAASQSLGDAVEAFERDMIEDALKMARGNRARAARLLQATRRIINYKIQQYGIDWRRYQDQDSDRSSAG
jgi:Nif-specific regulatory protein